LQIVTPDSNITTPTGPGTSCTVYECTADHVCSPGATTICSRDTVCCPGKGCIPSSQCFLATDQ
jgi:hypothetical protein